MVRAAPEGALAFDVTSTCFSCQETDSKTCSLHTCCNPAKTKKSQSVPCPSHAFNCSSSRSCRQASKLQVYNSYLYLSQKLILITGFQQTSEAQAVLITIWHSEAP